MTDLSKERLEALHNSYAEDKRIQEQFGDGDYANESGDIMRIIEELLHRREAAEKPVAWVNNCNESVPAALRFLAESPRPNTGNSRYNTEHLYQLAREIELSSPLTSAERERLAELEAKFARLPADWEKDSSLETWFPLTAERLAAYDRASKEPVVLPDYMPRINDATLDNIRNQDEEGSVANAARMLAIEVKFWHSKPLFTSPPLPVVPQTLLRELVDVVWQEAKESTEVPSTKWADELIGKVFPAAQSLPVVPVALCDERAGSGGISKLTGFNALPHGAPLYSAPQAVSQSYRNGIEAAASFLDKQREAFDNEHGQRDPYTGTFEFGNLAASEYSDTLEELAEGIRALNVEPSTQDAVAWRWFDGRGYNSTTDKSQADELVKDGVTVEALGPLQTLPIVPDSGVTAEHRRVIGMLLSVCGAAFELADDACEQEVDGEQCRVVPSDSFVKLSDALDEIENSLPTEDADRPDVFLAWAAMPRAALKSILKLSATPQPNKDNS